MRKHHSFLWQVPLTSFQKFDHGKEIEDVIPADLTPVSGDTITYEAGPSIWGIAEIVSCSENGGLSVFLMPCDEYDDRTVPGVRCTFKKIS